MGFPIGYTELLLPKLLLFTLLALGSLRKLILSLFRSMGLGDFLEPEISWPTRPDCAPDLEPRSGSSVLIRELLPVARFSDLVDPQESCAVCLHEFGGGDEVRCLANCCHIFHRSCLDPWIDHGHRTCPLCRTRFVPDDSNERVWDGSGVSDFYGEYSLITTGF
ncbi:brassinosteroid-responsive RING protein 1-like [Actinidia eriantha]|uniref:brassinosteroid-responsive RING protein 1-like n=1 Tax=Actinidia eriantha TaxID=165200 RepID=UPI00258956F0|nr:brassinosteroid-responsive RING protein 1-like [Actinidia eriantha]